MKKLCALVTVENDLSVFRLLNRSAMRAITLFLSLSLFIVSNSEAQYCDAGANTIGCTTGDEYISNVTFNSINNTSGCPTSNQYSDFTAISTTVTQGLSYSCSVLTPNWFTDDQATVWIDFNQNNSFYDAGEQFNLTTGGGNGTTPLSGTITIPVTASTGVTRMRVRLNYTGTMDPCGFTTFGEVEDYTVDIAPGTACTATPAPGNTLSTVAASCSGQSFTVSIQNTSTDVGFSYLWQWSLDGVVYTDIPGAPDAPSYTLTQDEPWWYQCVVTCTNSGLSATSTPVFVDVNLPQDCYCINPLYSFAPGCDYNIFISNFTLGGINNNTGCNGVAPYFNDYTGISANVTQNTNYSFSVSSPATPAFSMHFAIWIDFNDNGSFEDAGENILTSGELGNITNTFSGTWSVGTSPTGTHRLRVRCYDQTFIINSCTDDGIVGEVEDYTITISPQAACSGTPVPGATTSTANPVCSGVPFTLGFQNTLTESGLNYQWQYSTNGSTWNNIAGNAPTLTTSQTSSRYYRCRVQCTGGGIGTSTPLLVTMSPPLACYCTPPASSAPCVYMWISNVNTSGAVTNFNNSTGCSSSSFATYNGMSASQYQNQLVNMSFSSVTYAMGFSVWIDFNDNGVFDASEQVISVYNGLITGVTASFTVPNTAPAGQHKMRVRGEYAAAPFDACNMLTYGETEDYAFTVLQAVPCSSTPAPGNTTTTASVVCSTESFTLGLQNNPTESGITYQWQSSPDGASWTNVGPNTATYTLTQASATYYQCIVTCANTGESATSASVLISQSVCYCTNPVYGLSGCIYGLYINNVLFADINNTTGCNGIAPYYTYFSSITANVNQTQSYSITISTPPFADATYPGGVFQFYKVYIDFNDNGDFEDAGELVYDSGNIGTYPDNSSSGVIVIDANAPLGTHRMRVRSANGDVNSCTIDGVGGEVEDYNITIHPAPACSGTPTPGNTLTPVNLVCSSTSFTMSLENATAGTGITYQWQSSPDNAVWTDIPSATSSTLTTSENATTWYRCQVTCSDGPVTGASEPLQVFHTDACYCTNPFYSFGGGCGNAIYIDNFNFAGIDNTTGCLGDAPNYRFYDLTASVVQGSTYPISITTPPFSAANFLHYFKVYIDYNDNGSFDDAGEEIHNSGNVGTVINQSSGSYTIPLTAPLGTHLMRVRDANADANSCTSDGTSGEVEDYKITIVAPPPCNGMPSPGNTTTTASSVCPTIPFTLSFSNVVAESDITYDWQSSPDGVDYTHIAGSPDAPSYTLTQDVPTWYQCVITCNNTGLSATATPVFVDESPIVACYCSAGANTIGCTSGDEYIINVTFNTINNNSTCAAFGQYSDFTSQVTTVLMTSTYNASVLIPNWFDGDQVSIWIDLNQNGSFYDAGEKFDLLTGGTNGTTPFSGTITIPSTATPGITRMRVRANYTGVMDPCGFTTYGEVEDYSVNIVSPDPSWTGLDADYCVDASAVLLIPTNSGGIFTGPGVIPFGADYYFDPGSAGVGGPYTITYTIGNLTDSKTTTVHELPTVTLPAFSDVCNIDPEFALTGGAPGGGVYFVDANPATTFDPATVGDGEHTIFYVFTDVYGCSSFDQKTITVQTATTYFLDSDGDGYYTGDAVTTCTNPGAGYITNPTAGGDCDDNNSATYPGAVETANGVDDNCDGEVDEGLCTIPTGLHTTNITSNSATLNWDPVAVAIRYKAQYRIADPGSPWFHQNALAPATSMTITELESGTKYKWKLRSICSGEKTIFSPIVKFTTTSTKEGDILDASSEGNAKLAVYPNPSNGAFVIEMSSGLGENTYADVQILNSLGQVVFVNRTGIQNGLLKEEMNPMSELPAGNYLVRIILTDKIYSEQIVIQK